MSGLDSRFISSIDLEPYFVSNQNGEANAFGIVTFYKDSQRTSQKLVYQLSQDPLTGNYSYVALPNPMILSGIGTFQNAGGDNIAVYYFPYDAKGNQELYYITVDDQYGNRQFTREAWPFPHIQGSSAAADAIGLTNQLSNPQFTNINFVSPLSLSAAIISGAGTYNIPIAADWTLVLVTTGASTLSVTQTAVTGQSKLPYNPPFTLDVVYGANVSSCQLIQTLNNNPDWAAPQTAGVMGYLSGSILIGDGTSVSMQYKPSAGNPAQTILNVANASGAYVQETGTIQLQAANNTATGATGYDQIIINLLSATSSISNVQVIPMTSNVSGVQYDQTPVNRQIDHLFNYYNSLLQYKPIKSLLVGWDFPLNPAQFNSRTVASQALGANTSYYAWDQTIIYQSVTNSVAVSTNTGGDLVLTASADTQIAIIQYLPLPQALEFLYTPLAANVLAETSQANGIVATLSLWYTGGATLPDLKAPNYKSIVATLDDNGYPATFNLAGGAPWLEIGRSGPSSTSLNTSLLGNAKFTIAQDITNGAFGSYSFTGWTAVNPGDNHSETFIAVVLGFGTLLNTKSITIKSISVVPGQIPTIPAPQTADEVLRECQAYYEKSFQIATKPANGAGKGSGEALITQAVGATTATYSPTISYKVTKITTPHQILFYNPISNNSDAYNEVANADCSATTQSVNTQNNFAFTYTTAVGSSAGQINGLHWTSDARLGQ